MKAKPRASRLKTKEKIIAKNMEVTIAISTSKRSTRRVMGIKKGDAYNPISLTIIFARKKPNKVIE